MSHEEMPMVKMVARGFTAAADAYLTPHIMRCVVLMSVMFMSVMFISVFMSIVLYERSAYERVNTGAECYNVRCSKV